MGHDVSTIGNHKLDVRNIEFLAKDLSKRFKANIEYGYYHQYWFDVDGNEVEPTYENIVFNKILYPGSNQTIWLSDGFYQFRQVLDKHGNDYNSLSCFKNSTLLTEEFEAAKKGVSYAMYDYENDIDFGTIYNDTFHNFWHTFDGRWWWFCRAFMEADDYIEGNLDLVNDYRKLILDFYSRMGGTEVVHLDDQGKSEYLTHKYHNWNEIISKLDVNFKETTLNVSEFMKHKKLWPKDQYPLAFYDDFSDLIKKPIG